MGMFDAIMGRKKPPKPDLDNLFGLPSAAITLEAAVGFTPTGTGAVAFRAPEGKAFADVAAEVTELVSGSGKLPIEVTTDEYGYTWVVLTTEPPDMATLVTDLHAVNVSLVDAGFGPTLLCTLVTFGDERGRRLALVYLFKQGSFYPFVPDPESGPNRRDNIVELQVRDLVADDLRVEPDLTRWFAIWGAPGLG
ncbi:MAG: hypothetical protein H6525_05225 [Actinobacteria bacterium]|nr:hypothetical protein [Actinomycetota bacterium]MCB9412233.1 hypothetical protein [Actinomycetota bacterium]